MILPFLTAATAATDAKDAGSAATPATATDAATARSFDPVARMEYWGEQAWLWIQGHAGDIALASVIGVIVYTILAFIRRFAVRRAAKISGSLQLSDILLRTVAKTRSIVLMIVAVHMVIGIANPPQIVTRLVAIAFTIAAVMQVAIWAREILLGFIMRRAEHGDSETLTNAMGIIRLLISVALFAVAAIVILDNLGVNVTGLVAGLGIGGIAIGLAAQGIFGDLFAALSIIFDRPFRKGETIRYDTTTATVERIGLKSTRLRSVNGEQLIISNTNLLGKEIANFARLNRRRVQFIIGFVYQSSPDRLRALPALLQSVVEAQGHEFVRASMTAFGPSSLDFELLFDVMSDDYEVVAAGRTATGIAVFERLLADGYEIAYPTQTTFTAAPDGTMIMPYAGAPAPEPQRTQQ